METPGELQSWRARLTEAGIAFDEEDHGQQASIYFADPAGNVLEITAPPSTAVHEANSDAMTIAKRWIAGA